MLNEDYIPPRPPIPGQLDVNGEPDQGDPGSDYDLPVGWSFRYVCERDDCRGATRVVQDGEDPPRFCSPGCEEIVRQRQLAERGGVPALNYTPGR